MRGVLKNYLTLLVNKILGMFIRCGQPFLIELVLWDELSSRLHGIKAYHRTNKAHTTYPVTNILEKILACTWGMVLRNNHTLFVDMQDLAHVYKKWDPLIYSWYQSLPQDEWAHNTYLVTNTRKNTGLHMWESDEG